MGHRVVFPYIPFSPVDVDKRTKTQNMNGKKKCKKHLFVCVLGRLCDAGLKMDVNIFFPTLSKTFFSMRHKAEISEAATYLHTHKQTHTDRHLYIPQDLHNRAYRSTLLINLPQQCIIPFLNTEIKLVSCLCSSFPYIYPHLRKYM